ncbi:Putative uncharacterized protein [Lacticaseibacillus paracasei]|nr:Putative uncharacterized protein [Lacticaseibacillus paracasei]
MLDYIRDDEVVVLRIDRLVAILMI